MLKIGLNPYGLTYVLGLQGQGTPRANPNCRGLEGFIAIARELKAQVLEIFNPWLVAMSCDELKALRQRLQDLEMIPVISSGLNMPGSIEGALRSADALGAQVIRLGLTSVLEGSRNTWGVKWFELQASVRSELDIYAPQAAQRGVTLAIENHQDFTGQELIDFCEKFGPSIGICFDTGNAFPVCQSPLDFARDVAPYVRHVHLKDYRVQFTDQGYRLVRCAIGEGAVPVKAIADILARHHPGLTAVLEPGALEARHIRFLEPEWWRGYAPMDARSLAAAIAAARMNLIPEDADTRTPWERQADHELVDYELQMIRRSAANMRALGLMN